MLSKPVFVRQLSIEVLTEGKCLLVSSFIFVNHIVQLISIKRISPYADTDGELRQKESVSPLDVAWIVWEASIRLKTVI